MSTAPEQTFTLSSYEWSFEGDEGLVDGSGYAFLNSNGEPYFDMTSENERLEDLDGIVTQVAGVSFYPHLQDTCFDPGEVLSLVAEPNNLHDRNAVAVWDATRQKQLGHLPRQVAPEVADALAEGRKRNAMALWQWRKQGQRVGVRVLIAPEIHRMQ